MLVESKKNTKIGKEKYQSLKDKIIVLITQRSDVTQALASKLLNVPKSHVAGALTSLRKGGLYVFSPKGADTPLKIVRSQKDAEMYMNHRDRLYLDTATRMVTTAIEFGETYQELSYKKNELLEKLNRATYELPKRTR